jgi:hypothetical protein
MTLHPKVIAMVDECFKHKSKAMQDNILRYRVMEGLMGYKCDPIGFIIGDEDYSDELEFKHPNDFMDKILKRLDNDQNSVNALIGYWFIYRQVGIEFWPQCLKVFHENGYTVWS